MNTSIQREGSDSSSIAVVMSSCLGQSRTAAEVVDILSHNNHRFPAPAQREQIARIGLTSAESIVNSTGDFAGGIHVIGASLRFLKAPGRGVVGVELDPCLRETKAHGLRMLAELVELRGGVNFQTKSGDLYDLAAALTKEPLVGKAMLNRVVGLSLRNGNAGEMETLVVAGKELSNKGGQPSIAFRMLAESVCLAAKGAVSRDEVETLHRNALRLLEDYSERDLPFAKFVVALCHSSLGDEELSEKALREVFSLEPNCRVRRYCELLREKNGQVALDGSF